MEDLIFTSLMVLLLPEVTAGDAHDLNSPWWFYKLEATISTSFSTWVVKMHSKTASKPQYLFSHIKCGNILLLFFNYFLSIKSWDPNFIESQRPYTPFLNNHIESSTLMNIWPMWAHSTYLVLINSLTLHSLITNRFSFHDHQLKRVLSTITSLDFHHSLIANPKYLVYQHVTCLLSFPLQCKLRAAPCISYTYILKNLEKCQAKK